MNSSSALAPGGFLSGLNPFFQSDFLGSDHRPGFRQALPLFGQGYVHLCLHDEERKHRRTGGDKNGQKHPKERIHSAT